MIKNKEQLIKLMGFYATKHDYKNAKKIATKLIEADSARLKQLSTIGIDVCNYRAVMDEIEQIGKATKIWLKFIEVKHGLPTQ